MGHAPTASQQAHLGSALAGGPRRSTAVAAACCWLLVSWRWRLVLVCRLFRLLIHPIILLRLVVELQLQLCRSEEKGAV